MNWEPVLFMLEQNFFLVFILLLSLIWAGERVFTALIEKRRQTAIQEQKAKQLQALASLDDVGRQKLLELMPDWLDPDDPDEVEAWKAARRETLQLTKKES